jgi:hypothetical protein
MLFLPACHVIVTRRWGLVCRQRYCGEDTTDAQASANNQTMNLKELFQLMKDCNQMDAKFSVRDVGFGTEGSRLRAEGWLSFVLA